MGTKNGNEKQEFNRARSLNIYCFLLNVKVKVSLHALKVSGEVEVYLHTFLIQQPDRDGWSDSWNSHFLVREECRSTY
jgi:hypothetical protein